LNIQIRRPAVDVAVVVADDVVVAVDVGEDFRRRKGVAWDDAERPSPC